MHNPRGSNNRNCRSDNNKARRNGNRLFDSENNDNGGYNCDRAWPFPCYKYMDDATAREECQATNSNLSDEQKKNQVTQQGELLTEGATNTPRMYFWSGSKLQLEWTNQHGSGTNDEVHAEIVIQYACDDTLVDNCGTKINTRKKFPQESPFRADPGRPVCTMRDGTPVAVQDGDTIRNVEANERISDNIDDLSEQDDGRFGRHETLEYYQECNRRERNKGLFTADQNVANNRGAKATRQNPNGNDRYGLECPEESQYYPYWHWTPWKDIAILADSDRNFELYKKESGNVREKGRCDCDTECQNDSSQPNNEAACNVAGFTWVEDPPHNISAPDTIVSDFRVQNSLGEKNHYVWTIPNVEQEQRCVLRIRYNISTTDGYDEDGSRQEVTLDGTAKENDAASPIYDNDENEALTYMKIAGLDGEGSLGFAINTNQFGRTFQDRSYVFHIKPRSMMNNHGEDDEVAEEKGVRVAGVDGNCNKKPIWNLNIRGKRGNIVQAYPAVEYDFVPTYLDVQKDECVHVQWTGSDYNPDRDGNNGEGGPVRSSQDDLNGGRTADRHNLVETKLAGDNLANMDASKFSVFATNKRTWERLAFLDQQWTNGNLCWDFQRLNENYNNRANREENHYNCMKLSGALTPYFDAGVLQPGEKGRHTFMSTRDNNFSNRGMKAEVNVTPALSGGELAGVIAGVAVAVAAVGLFVARRRRQNSAAGGSQLAPHGGARGNRSSGGPITALFAGVGALKTRWGGAGGAAAGGAKPAGDGYVIASFPHQATESNELSFNKGDRIRIITRDPSGWWTGEVNGRQGLFPANYVK